MPTPVGPWRPAYLRGWNYDGPDIASYQHPLDWSLVPQPGEIDLFAQKLTQGTSYVNPFFAADWAPMQRYRYAAVYHWLDPGNGAGQARFFVSKLPAGFGSQPGHLWFLDHEAGASDDDVDAFMTTVGLALAARALIYGGWSTLARPRVARWSNGGILASYNSREKYPSPAGVVIRQWGGGAEGDPLYGCKSPSSYLVTPPGWSRADSNHIEDRAALDRIAGYDGSQPAPPAPTPLPPPTPPIALAQEDDVDFITNAGPYPSFPGQDGTPPDGVAWPVGWVVWAVMPDGSKRNARGAEWKARMAAGRTAAPLAVGDIQSIPDYVPQGGGATVQPKVVHITSVPGDAAIGY